jgi:hypothetical protein
VATSTPELRLEDTHCRTIRNVVHVLPVGDLIEHQEHGFGCVCGPKVECEFDVCGCHAGWVVVHNALDGRL